MNHVQEKLREARRVFGAENWTNNATEKLREAGRLFGAENWTNNATEKLREAGRLFGAENLTNYAPEKWKQFLPELGHFVEQIKPLVKVATPYIIAVAVFYILFRCSGGCGRAVKMMIAPFKMMIKMMIAPFKMMKAPCGGAVKMMIAPGTGRAFMIARAPFEAAPKMYFRGLRGK